MKGVKLLFTALLCLLTSGARADNTTTTQDDENQDVIIIGTNGTRSTTSGTYNVNNVGTSYAASVTDTNTGLIYRFTSLSSNAEQYSDCAVGLAGTYKETAQSPKTSVRIPSTVKVVYWVDGTRYIRVKNVKYIVDYGFTTSNNGTNPAYNWTFTFNPSQSYKAPTASETKSYTFTPLSSRSGYYNPNLESVTFADNSQITQIGIGAFQGCINLKSIVIPSSVTEIFDNAFTYCIYTKSIEFQTTESTDATTGITTQKAGITYLPWNCFYMCNSLESLDIPEGVTYIGDYALQDCWSLKEISLPSTLTTIGSHFLCRALSLTQFYLPSSVTSISGAFLHGCENMRDVYLMGSAATLASDDGSSYSFYGESTTVTPAVYGVNNCTFHISEAYATTDNYLSTSNTWYKVYGGANDQPGFNGSQQSADNVDLNDYTTITYSDGTTSTIPNPAYNRIVWPTEDNQEQYQKTFGPYKWQSVIFYKSMTQSEFKSEFGDDALVAQFTGCTKESTDSKHYSFWFETISSDIPAKTPLMIYVDNKTVTHQMYDLGTTVAQSEDFRTFYTKRYNVSVPVKVNGAETGEKAVMVGLAVPIPFSAGDFSFQWVTNSTDHTKSYGQFRGARVTGQSGYKGRYSCLWNITDNGTKLAGQEVQVSSAKRFMPAVTGINGVKTEEQPTFDINIYDLSGRLVGTSRSDLPRGMYIQGGKKFIKK